MMNAEENVDIDLNFDDPPDSIYKEEESILQCTDAPALEVDLVTPPPSIPIESATSEVDLVSPPPVVPMFKQNSIEDVLRNQEDADDSSSSEEENSVVTVIANSDSKFIQKNTAGLFENIDEVDDFMLDSPLDSPLSSPMDSPPTANKPLQSSQNIDTLTTNLQAVSLDSNDITSKSTTTLFSNDQCDDFLNTPSPPALQRTPDAVSSAFQVAPESNTIVSPGYQEAPGNNAIASPLFQGPPENDIMLSPLQGESHGPAVKLSGTDTAEAQLTSNGYENKNTVNAYLPPAPSTNTQLSNYSNRSHNIPEHVDDHNTPLMFNPMNQNNQSSIYSNQNYMNTNLISSPNPTPIQHSIPTTPVVGHNSQVSTPAYGGSAINNYPTPPNNVAEVNNSVYNPGYDMRSPISHNIQNTSPEVNNTNNTPRYASPIQHATPVINNGMTQNGIPGYQNNTPVYNNGISQNGTPGYQGNGCNVINSPQFCGSMHTTNYETPQKDYQQIVHDKETTSNRKSNDLFIPQMYSNNSASANTPTFFVPEQTSSNVSNMCSPLFNPLPSHVNNEVSPPTYAESVYSHGTQFDIAPLANHNGNDTDKGILEWLKDRVIKDFPTGATNLKKYMKSATDSVLTTLDPGMKGYLKPGKHIAVATQSMAMLIGIKDGFTAALNSIPVVQGHTVNHVDAVSTPLGFETAIQSTYENLEYLSSLRLPQEPLLMSSQVFLTELVSQEWYIMYCIALKDQLKDVHLHAFSQPIPLPNGCIEASYSHMIQNESGECAGYSIPIEEIVRRYIPYEKDWCSVLTGKELHQVISMTVQSMAIDYQRRTNIITTQQHVGGYSNNTNYYYNGGATTNNTQQYYQQPPPPPPPTQQQQHQQYSLSLDAIS